VALQSCETDGNAIDPYVSTFSDDGFLLSTPLPSFQIVKCFGKFFRFHKKFPGAQLSGQSSGTDTSCRIIPGADPVSGELGLLFHARRIFLQKRMVF
jgi:hypothetical protein